MSGVTECIAEMRESLDLRDLLPHGAFDVRVRYEQTGATVLAVTCRCGRSFDWAGSLPGQLLFNWLVNHCDEAPPQRGFETARKPFVPVLKRPTPDMKLTPEEWCRAYDVCVINPDGWRGRDALDWNEPITLIEFERRATLSTTNATSPGWDGVVRDVRLCREDMAGRESTS